jgi:hypothetical protein
MGALGVFDGGVDVDGGTGGGVGLVDGPDGLGAPSSEPTTVVRVFVVRLTVVSRSETVVFTVLLRPSSSNTRGLLEVLVSAPVFVVGLALVADVDVPRVVAV